MPPKRPRLSAESDDQQPRATEQPNPHSQPSVDANVPGHDPEIRTTVADSAGRSLSDSGNFLGK